MCIPTANGESSSAVSVRWCGHYSWLKLVCEARRPGRNLSPTVRCVSTVWVLTLHESQVHECNYSKSPLTEVHMQQGQLTSCSCCMYTKPKGHTHAAYR